MNLGVNILDIEIAKDLGPLMVRLTSVRISKGRSDHHHDSTILTGRFSVFYGSPIFSLFSLSERAFTEKQSET